MLRLSPLLVVLQLVTTNSTFAQPGTLTQRSAYRQLAGMPPAGNSHPIELATHEQSIPPTDVSEKATDSRRLAPRHARPADTAAKKSESLLDRLHIPRGSTPATFAALAIVTGLLILAMSGLKRSLPRSMQLLPADAASVVGRMHLTGKQFAHLVKLGDKLVLVCISSNGVDTITEVTDPDQVTRLLAICSSGAPQSLKHDFDRILQQLASEPARPGFLGEDTLAATSRGGYRRA
jgi:hypothetical protein